MDNKESNVGNDSSIPDCAGASAAAVNVPTPAAKIICQTKKTETTPGFYKASLKLIILEERKVTALEKIA